MPDWANDPTDWEAILTALIIVMGVIGWLIRAEVRKNTDETAASHAQLIPNHGTSLRDAVDRLEASLALLHTDVKDNARYARQDLERFDATNAAGHDALMDQLERVRGRVDSHIDSHVTQNRKDVTP